MSEAAENWDKMKNENCLAFSNRQPVPRVTVTFIRSFDGTLGPRISRIPVEGTGH